MTLDELQARSFTIAKDKHPHFRQHRNEEGSFELVIPKGLTHLHSEVSEIYEEYRVARPGDGMSFIWMSDLPLEMDYKTEAGFAKMLEHAKQGRKPLGPGAEFADVFINAAELSAWCGVDLEKAVQLKLAYYATRSVRHGKVR
jgi:hypothetical protein